MSVRSEHTTHAGGFHEIEQAIIVFFLFRFMRIVSELSFQDGSVYNSEMECTNNEQHEDSPTEPLDVELVQPAQRLCESPATLPPPQGHSQIQVGSVLGLSEKHTS